MSSDLIVLGPQPPDGEALRAAVRVTLGQDADAVTVSGELDAGEGVELRTVAGDPLLLAGPAELLPVDEIRDTIGPAGSTAADRWLGAPELWWFEIQVPAAGGALGRAFAGAIAERLAAATRGTVVDLAAAD